MVLKSGDIEEQEIFQVVLIADTFTSQFQPISNEIPQALIPFLNAPLIDHSLDWLNRCGVEELIVYCAETPFSSDLAEHCQKFTRQNNISSMKINVVSSATSTSVGDALRDLYSKSVLKSNFVLLSGNVIGNIDLKKLMLNHKQQRLQDKNSILTAVFSPGFASSLLSSDSSVLLVLNKKTNKIMHFSSRLPHEKIIIPTDAFTACLDLSVLPSAINTSVIFCTEMVPSLFTDNYDYNTVDRLMSGIIEQEELLGYNMYAKILKSGYCYPVTSFVSYEKASLDLMQRLVYPSVPEVSSFTHRMRYEFEPIKFVYADCSTVFHKDPTRENSTFGVGTEIGTGNVVKNAVIGNNCKIGTNSYIDHGFIMNHTEIGSSCNLEQCFIGENVTLFNNVSIGKGCVLGANVKIGPDVTIPPLIRVSAVPLNKLDKALDASFIGNRGHGFIWKRIYDESIEKFPVWGKSYPMDNEGSEGADDSSDENLQSVEEEQYDEDFEFKREVQESLLHSLTSGSTTENVILEINASRAAYNILMTDVLSVVTQGILTVGEDNDSGIAADKIWLTVKKGLDRYASILHNYMKKTPDQFTVLSAIEALVDEKKHYTVVLQNLLYELSQTHGVLDDDVILQWYKKGIAKGKTFLPIQNSVAKFVKWLEEAEEESD